VDVLDELNETIGHLIEITERQRAAALDEIERHALAGDREGIEEQSAAHEAWRRAGEGYRALLTASASSPIRRVK